MKKNNFHYFLYLLLMIAAISCKKSDKRFTTENNIFPFYELQWQDEFDGTHIDSTKWDFRQDGTQRFQGTVSNKAVSLNGQGELIIKILKERDQFYIGQISTQHTYFPTYGYFECRAKMLTQIGPHTSFWMQSHTINETGNNPSKNGAEIDVFEFVKYSPNSVYQTIHWDGYGPETKGTGKTTHINKIDEGYHTFGVEWTDKQYIFFVDGLETWRTTDGLSKTSQYMILSTELDGFGGNPTQGNYPDSVCFDYVRVYQKK